VCGNSKVETGETCDDGNKTAGDGCSATCQTEDATAYPPGSIQLLGGGCTAAPAGSTSGGGLWAVLGLLAALLMVRLRRAPQAAWLVLVALIAAPNAYAADGGYSLQRFRAQTSTQGLLHSEGAKILDAWTPAVGLWLHYDHQPLTVSDAATGDKLYDEVGRQVSAQLVAALGLFGFAELGLAIPVVLNQSGEDRPTGLGTAPSLGAGAGDIRLIPKVKLLQTGALNIALSAAFDLPTASAAYSGDDGVGVEPRLNASLQDTTYGALVGLGTRIRPSFSPTITGSNQSIQIGNEAQATLGGWLNVVPETLDLLVDSRFAVNLEQQDAEERSGEVLGGVRLHLPAELVATAAAGPGFGQSPGTPAFRAVLGLMWAPNPGLDTDGDGMVDKQDKCPKVAEDKDAFEDGDGCIDPDNDKDGILDVDDKCPLDPEDKDQFEDENGCPDPDNDKDGILDVNDKCPIEFGVKEEEGCPVRDRDGDGYPDKTDKCPDKPETFNGIEDEDGCPDKANKVEVTETEIKILDKVFFDTAKATIKPVSFPILDAVAAVLKSTPRVGKVRVEGHTDDVDTDENNNKLSQARSESVMAYLVGKGVAAERLVARGFGESKPLCKDTPDLLTKGKKAKKQLDACRETNRRVQFKLLEMNGKTLPEDEDPQTIETSRPAK
jgi:cysteine-rich repeat protein